MPTPRLALLLLTIAWIPAGISVSAQGDSPTSGNLTNASQSPSEESTATELIDEEATPVSEEATTSDAETEKTNAETELAPEVSSELGTAAKIDKLFGDWVVSPFARVLFFDFWTEDWLGTSIPFVVIWLLSGAVFLTLRMVSSTSEHSSSD